MARFWLAGNSQRCACCGAPQRWLLAPVSATRHPVFPPGISRCQWRGCRSTVDSTAGFCAQHGAFLAAVERDYADREHATD